MHNVRMLAAQRQRVAKSFAIASGLTSSTLASAALTPRAQVTTVVVAGDAPHYVKIVVLLKAPGQSQTVLSRAGTAMGIQGLTAKGARHRQHDSRVRRPLSLPQCRPGISRRHLRPFEETCDLHGQQMGTHRSPAPAMPTPSPPSPSRRQCDLTQIGPAAAGPSTASRSRFFETRFPRPPHRQLSPRRCTVNVRDPGCQWNRASLQVGTLR